MDANNKIGKIEAIALIVIIMISQIILDLPNTILKSSGNGILLNTIYISIIAVLFCLLICKLYIPFQGKDILEVSEYLGGKFLKNFIGLLYMVFFLIVMSFLLRYFANALKLIYFENISIIFIILFFIVPAAIISQMGLQSISRTNLILIFGILISILVLICSLSKNFSIDNLFPILGYGIKETFIYGSVNICIFSSIGYLYFLPPHLKNLSDFKKISIASTVISAIFLILSSVSLLLLFPFLTQSSETLSLYFSSRLIKYGNFLQRVDAIFIFIWILGILSYLSITFFYILNIFKKLTKVKREQEVSFSLLAIIFAISLIPRNISDIEFIEKYIYKYFALILIFVCSALILLLSYSKSKKEKKEDNKI